MLLVFIFCTIGILLILFMFLIFLSTLKIQIKNFEATNMKNRVKHILPNYEFKLSLCLFNKIKWFSIKIDKRRVEKIYRDIKSNKINLKEMEKNIKFKNLMYINELEPKISYLNLDVKLGTEDALLTSSIVFGISTIISVLLPYAIKKYNKNKYFYQILPVYVSKNVYKIKLDCIIEIKMVHIITIIYVLLKKRRVDKYGKRASDRRSYGYSYE